MLTKIDKNIVIITGIIFLIGLSAIFSASSRANIGQFNFTFVQKQIVWASLALCAAYLIIRSDYRKLLGWAYPLFFLGNALLILVLVMGIVRLGAQRWIRIGFFNFQPSEIMKIIFIIAMANYVSQNPDKMKRLRGVFDIAVITGIPLLLILIEPDLGTAIMLIPICFAMLYAGGFKLKYLLFMIGASLMSMPFLWHFLKDYQKQRLMVFLNPNIDPLGAGYTVIQSKIAIGSGWVLGKGWLSGTQNQLNFLPERHTDFIFSVVGEEWGFVGCLFILFMYFLLIKRIFQVGINSKDKGALLICVGIGTMLAFQVLINIAMTSGFMPIVGLPLPLMTYGGSSLITTAISISIVLSISMRNNFF